MVVYFLYKISIVHSLFTYCFIRNIVIITYLFYNIYIFKTPLNIKIFHYFLAMVIELLHSKKHSVFIVSIKLEKVEVYVFRKSN